MAFETVFDRYDGYLLYFASAKVSIPSRARAKETRGLACEGGRKRWVGLGVLADNLINIGKALLRRMPRHGRAACLAAAKRNTKNGHSRTAGPAFGSRPVRSKQPCFGAQST